MRTAFAILTTVSVLLGLTVSRPVHANADAAPPPTTVTTSYSTTFQTTGDQNMWGPGAAHEINNDLALINFPWNPVPVDINAIANAGFGQFGAEFKAGSHGAIGLTAHMHATLGSVRMSYPVRVDLTTPAPKSFRPGDTVTVGSHWTPPDPNGWTCSNAHGTAVCNNTSGASFTAVSPQATLSLTGNLDFHAYADLNVCVFACTGDISLFALAGIWPGDIDLSSGGERTIPVPVPYYDSDLSGIGGVGFRVGDAWNLGTDGFVLNAGDFGVTGTIGNPLVNLSNANVSADGTMNLSGTGTFVDLQLDVVQMIRQALGTIGIPLPALSVQAGNITVAGIRNSSLDVTLLQLVQNLVLQSQRNFTFHPSLQVALQLPAGTTIPYQILDGSGVVANAFGNSVNFPAGDRASFVYPSGMPSLTLAPAFTLDNTLSNISSTGLSFSPNDDTLGRFSLHIPGVVDTHYGPLIDGNSFIPTLSTNFGGIFDPNPTFTLGGFTPFAPVDLAGNPTVLTLDPKHPLTVTADNQARLYGDPNPSLTGSVTGFDPGDEGSITAGFSTPADASSAVGTYLITSIINDPQGKLWKYYIVEHDGALTVHPAPLTVNTDSKTMVYGDPPPSLTGSLVGIKNGDPIATTFSSNVTSQTDVGQYSISATLSDPAAKLGNYVVTNPGGVLRVLPAPLTVAVGNVVLQLHQPVPAPTGTLVGLKNNDSISASYTTTAASASPVGAYQIIATLSGPPTKLNDYVVTNNGGTLTITYRICALYDAAKAVQSGATLPLKLQLCDFSGLNVSSADVPVTALRLTDGAGNVLAPNSAGNSNPGAQFRFTDGTYMFNLKTTGLAAGGYNLTFSAAGPNPDPLTHDAPVLVK